MIEQRWNDGDPLHRDVPGSAVWHVGLFDRQKPASVLRGRRLMLDSQDSTGEQVTNRARNMPRGRRTFAHESLEAMRSFKPRWEKWSRA